MEPIPAPAKLLLIYVDETDTWGDEMQPLYDAIVRRLLQLGVAGATVQRGLMGFGANLRVHRPRLLGISDERPVVISVIDHEARLRSVMPELRSMIREGLVFLVDGEILHQGMGV